jgi:uncharacterized protein (TIGR02265 family)
VSEIVFAHTVDGLFYRALKGKVSRQLKAELATLGLDLDKKAIDVERERWAPMLAATVKALYPSLPTDEGYFRLGRAAMDGYESTVMGKALFAMMRLLGPTRTTRRVAENLRNANTYALAKHNELAPNKHEVWVNECNGNPGYLRGVLFGALERTGAQNIKVETLKFDGHAGTFAVSWDAR